MLNFPLFNEADYTLHQMNKTARVLLIPKAAAEDFYRYLSHFEKKGLVQKEFRTTDYSLFAAYWGKEECYFINYFKATNELQLVAETDCRYFDFSAPALKANTTPQITQMHLSDFGMCYIIRLSDGRFIVIDAGQEFKQDADRLYKELCDQSPFKAPIIAAWILTHPHSDHYHCLFPFFERHNEKIKVERFLLNFCEADDLAHYPKLANDDARFENDKREQTKIPLLNQLIKKSGTARYMPHTGQTYQIGDAAFEVLASMDDTIHCSQNINASSLVLRMTLADQIILWTADAGFSYARLPERYGRYLKSDILQVPHHGFGCGEVKAQIEGFKQIAPETCLLPVSDYHAFTAFSGYKEGTRFLMEELGITELITGDQTTTLPLPYTPRPQSAKHLASEFLKGRQDCGARTWVFTNLSTAQTTDFSFSLLNMTYLPQKVKIDLLFENRDFTIEGIACEANPFSITDLDLLKDPLVIENEFFGNPAFDQNKIPKSSPFAIRFTCKEPIVVSHKEHKETYHSIY